METIETGLKEALLNDGRVLLGQLLSHLAVADDVSRHGEESQGLRSRSVQTVLGPIELQRRYYHDPQMKRCRAPLDAALGLIDGYSPGLARLMCWAAGQCDSYADASQTLRRCGGLDVDARQIQRMANQMVPRLEKQLDQPGQAPTEPSVPVLYVSMDGTGVPMVTEELEGRAGKQPDGTARTREAKLGCVFTQHHVDEQGHPWRDLDSTTYVASFETAADFGHRLHREALRRNLLQAGKVIILGDGALWIWDLVAIHFPQAVQILDFYHACEHLKKLAQVLEQLDAPAAQALFDRWRDCLLHDQLDTIIADAIARLPRSGPRREEADRQLSYLETNRPRMHYATFRKRGWFIGSGVVEAGCKTVIGKRLKQSGMFWSLPGAHNVLTLRCACASRRFDQAWDQLPLAA